MAVASDELARPSAAARVLDIGPAAPARPGDARGRLRVSVIFPLFEIRLDTVKCLRSFAERQSLPREAYQVVVVSEGKDRALDESLRAVLIEGDRMVFAPGANRAAMCNLGVKHAEAPLIFLTECHCVGDRECLEQMLAFLETHDVTGASVTSRDGCVTPFARAEADRFNELAREWYRPGDWRKVMIRGFAFPRGLWHELGGFDERYPKYAEWLFAAKLNAKGIAVEYAESSVVTHFYSNSFSDLHAFTAQYAQEDCAARLEAPDWLSKKYLGQRENWAERESFRPRHARMLASAAARALRASRRGGPSGTVAGMMGELALCAPRALVGAWGVAGRHYLDVAWQRARCWWWRNDVDRLRPAYVAAYSALEGYYRMRFIARLSRVAAERPPPTAMTGIEVMPETQLLGFHGLESLGGAPFRWARPAAGLLLGNEPGDYELHIRTGELLPSPLAEVAAMFVNGRRLDRRRLGEDRGVLKARIARAMFHGGKGPEVVVIVTRPRRWNREGPDRRSLALPVFSIEMRQLAAGRVPAPAHSGAAGNSSKRSIA